MMRRLLLTVIVKILLIKFTFDLTNESNPMDEQTKIIFKKYKNNLKLVFYIAIAKAAVAIKLIVVSSGKPYKC